MIVLAPFPSTVTKKVKQDAWETIRTQLNGVGANIDCAKTLRDVLWATIRRSTLKKVSESKKTSAAGSRELTELDKAVLDILGRESAKIEPASEGRRFRHCIRRGLVVTTTPTVNYSPFLYDPALLNVRVLVQGEPERLLTQQIILMFSLGLFELGGVGNYTGEGEVQVSTAESGNGRGGSPKVLPKQSVLKQKLGQEKSSNSSSPLLWRNPRHRPLLLLGHREGFSQLIQISGQPLLPLRRVLRNKS